MSNLMSFNSPYVHSNLSRFNKNLSGSVLDNRSEEGEQRLSQQIQELMQVRNMLKAEADAFLGGIPYQSFFTSLNSNQTKMAQIGIEILNRQHVIDILSGKMRGYSQQDLITAFPKLAPALRKAVPEEGVLTAQQATTIVVDAVMKKMPKTGGKGSVQAQIDKLEKFFVNSQGEFEKEFREQVSGRLKSKTGKIKQIVQQAIHQRTNSKGSEKAMFVTYFRKEFMTLANQRLDFVTSNEIEEYLANIEKGVYALPDSVFTGEASSMTGKLGEDFMQIINTNDAAFDVVFDLTGMMTEQEIQNSSKLRGSIQGIMTTHHAASKESQTDMLVTSKKTNKTVRVQSKNLQAAYQSLVSVRPFPGFAQIQGATKYVNLIQQLQNTGTIHLSEQELGELSYLLANELWFRTHQSMDLGMARGVNSSGSTMNQVVSMVNQLLTKEIVNFMGINIEEVIHPNAASSANSFYLIANKVFLPSYLIIDDLIRELQQMQSDFARLSVSLDLSGSYGSASEFYKEKMQSVGALDPAGNYTDSALVAVGQQKGQDIINNLKIHKIGLKFDMQKLMQSSYVAF